MKPGSGRLLKATAAVRTWATQGNVMTQRKYETEPTVQQNGTDSFTPFLGKRCAVQHKWNGPFLEYFFDAYRIRVCGCAICYRARENLAYVGKCFLEITDFTSPMFSLPKLQISCG